jgi:hypothetical protein
MGAGRLSRAHTAGGRRGVGYTMPDHISFCREGGATILLDLQRDWYFQLDPALEPTFAALVEGQDVSVDPERVRHLLDLGVLQALPGRDARPTPAVCAAPILSWRDEAPGSCQSSAPSMLFIAEVWAAVRRARRQVRKVPFEQLIQRLRSVKRDQSAGPVDGDGEARLAQVAARFSRVRRGVPIDPICLQDSLALFDLCTRRRLFPDLVIGVATTPFKAHCWLQSGPVVLNESLDCAMSFQPILVV